ncbi:MAG: hypothetical protein Q9220_002941 [cf. Caloplaca sp. 1 TL-2023]
MAASGNRETATIRVRDNQRRSRARRREYVEELEKRVHNFERSGAQASVEIQAAARKVAHENSLLRRLLEQYGLTSNEVEAYLRGERAHTNIAPKPVAVTTSMLRDYRSPASSDSTSPTGKKILMQAPTQTRCCPAPTVVDSDDCHTPAAPSSTTPLSPTNSHNPSLESAFDQSITLSPAPVKMRQELRPRVLTASMDDTTDCETAARIIANMRGCDDMEGVRAELGCSSDASCTVKNTTVFSAMNS